MEWFIAAVAAVMVVSAIVPGSPPRDAPVAVQSGFECEHPHQPNGCAESETESED
jgi:hypothetical protein